jgi:uncharacterized membrane-anchored protein
VKREAAESTVERRRLALVWGGLALVVVVFLGLVAQKEAVLRDGQPLLLRLGPVDPRSLIEGDYMRLAYEIQAQADWPVDGKLVVRKDADGVGHLVRLHMPGEPLAPGEMLLRYRRRRWQTRLGAEAFYFQEGTAGRYANACYGELRVTPSGESVLVGLRDADRAQLGASAR